MTKFQKGDLVLMQPGHRFSSQIDLGVVGEVIRVESDDYLPVLVLWSGQTDENFGFWYEHDHLASVEASNRIASSLLRQD